MLGGRLVQEGRRRTGVTQAELAARAGTTQSAIARFESAKANPSWDSVIRLLRLLGFEPEIRLSPQTTDWSLARQSLKLSPDERVQRLIDTVEFIAKGREAMAQTRAKR